MCVHSRKSVVLFLPIGGSICTVSKLCGNVPGVCVPDVCASILFPGFSQEHPELQGARIWGSINRT